MRYPTSWIPTIAFALAVGSCATTGSAQPSTDAGVELAGCLEPLAFLVGEWSGNGTFLSRDGREREANAHESVSAELQGTALLIRGRGWRDVGGDTRIVHDALAVIRCDGPTARLFAFSAHGGQVESDIDLEDASVTWEYSPGDGVRVRNRLEIGALDAWTEVSQVSTDGKTWRDVMRMELRRSH